MEDVGNPNPTTEFSRKKKNSKPILQEKKRHLKGDERKDVMFHPDEKSKPSKLPIISNTVSLLPS